MPINQHFFGVAAARRVVATPKIMVLAIASAISSVAFAQPSNVGDAETAPSASLSLKAVVERTLLTNPEVLAKYHEFQAAMAGQTVARAAFLPQVTAVGSLNREYRRDVPGVGSQRWSGVGDHLELRQLLFNGLRTTNDVRQAGFERLARFYDVLAVSDATAFSAVQAYVDLQRYRQLETLARLNYDLHRETFKQIDQRTRSGVGRRVDQEQAGGRLALAQTNLMTETANLLDISQRFQRITGVIPTQFMQPLADLSSALPAKSAGFSESLRRNPALLSKQASLQAAQAGLASSEGAFSPTLEVVASTGRNPSDPMASNRDVRSSNIQMVMRYNLYRGGADSARVSQTAAQSYAARDIRDYTCRNVQQDLAVAWNNIVSLNAKLPFLRDHENSTAKVHAAYRQQFQIGQRSLMDLLDTENELFESRRALINGEQDAILAQYRWLALSHGLLPALSLRPAHVDTAEESGRLEIPEDAIARCQSTMQGATHVQPVQVHYNNGDLPPTLSPLGVPGAKR
jgi:adhesin transport system outer membrane protein